MFRRFRPSPAMVVALLALFVSLGGVSYAAAKIGTGQIKDGAVTASKLHKNAVTTKKIKKAAVTNPKIADDAVQTGKIADASVTTDKLADTSVTTGKLADASVTTDKLADTSVTTGKLADASVTTDKLADNAITSAKITDGQVLAGDLGSIIEVTNGATGIANGANGSVTATCPAGTVVISGGGQPTLFGVEMTSLLRSGNGWQYQARNLSGQTISLTAFAYCLSA